MDNRRLVEQNDLCRFFVIKRSKDGEGWTYQQIRPIIANWGYTSLADEDNSQIHHIGIRRTSFIQVTELIKNMV